MQEPKQEFDNVNLLWTGGWDSTFQLLQLLVINKQQVTPFYLIHAQRPSTGLEILTMERIKEILIIKYPYTAELLKPTQFYSNYDLLPNQEITKTYNRILKNKKFGIQYEWLARFCIEKGITDMQIGCEKGINFSKNHWTNSVYPYLIENIINSNKIYTIDPNHHDKDITDFFKHFQFPLAKLTKIKMAEITKNQGLDSIMNITWFCHKPTCNQKPCGKCNPCLEVIENGMSWRLSINRNIISFFYTNVFIKIKNLLRASLVTFGLYNRLKK